MGSGIQVHTTRFNSLMTFPGRTVLLLTSQRLNLALCGMHPSAPVQAVRLPPPIVASLLAVSGCPRGCRGTSMCGASAPDLWR